MDISAFPVFVCILVVLAIFFVMKAVRVVPQQEAWVIERFGKFSRVLDPGLNFLIPVVETVAYRQCLKEIPYDTPQQICITKDNSQLIVDGVLYYQVTDARLASYGTSDFVTAITQLAQTSLRSVVGKMNLDQTLQERDQINTSVGAAIDEAAPRWGVKVLRYEIRDLTPPDSVLKAMQLQITAEREKRAVIAQSEGEMQKQINLAEGKRNAIIAESEGEKMRQINLAEGKKNAMIAEAEGEKQATIKRAEAEAAAIKAVADARSNAIQMVADAINQHQGEMAVNFDVAREYIDAFGKIAKESNTLIIPGNLADAGSMLATAMTVINKTKDTK
jgi:regulator of protease activity HflC (stomatin/prohibitin superfamily)